MTQAIPLSVEQLQRLTIAAARIRAVAYQSEIAALRTEIAKRDELSAQAEFSYILQDALGTHGIDRERVRQCVVEYDVAGNVVSVCSPGGE